MEVELIWKQFCICDYASTTLADRHKMQPWKAFVIQTKKIIVFNFKSQYFTVKTRHQMTSIQV